MGENNKPVATGDSRKKGESDMEETVGRGLEDVVVAESDICFIDGHEGRLLYRGYNVDDLAREATYEEVAYLLWHGHLPKSAELKAFTEAIGKEAFLPPDVLAFLAGVPAGATPMEVLRTAVSMLSLSDPTSEHVGDQTDRTKALRLLAKTPSIVAAFDRLRNHQKPVMPRPDFGLAKNFLYMLHGEPPVDEDAHILDVCLILHADHEFNASTFAARVTAGTLSDMYSAITSAIGTLKGPLHGGANEQVMRMLLEIGAEDKVESWIKDALANKKKISGFGHRVYRTEDPRARHLRAFSEEIGTRRGDLKYFRMTQKVEQTVFAEKGIYLNVDLYSGSVYYQMGIAIDLFTPIFAIARTAGWTTHVMEQLAHNRLIRPRAQYVGPERELWVPIEKR